MVKNSKSLTKNPLTSLAKSNIEQNSTSQISVASPFSEFENIFFKLFRHNSLQMTDAKK